MNEKLLQIINYYGDALEHIKEEIGDLQTMLDQFKLLYNVTEEEIESVKAFKTDRQIRRIEESK